MISPLNVKIQSEAKLNSTHGLPFMLKAARSKFSVSVKADRSLEVLEVSYIVG